MVDDLPAQSDKVMYAKRQSEYSRYFDLYIITVEALKKNDFENAVEIEHDSDEIKTYSYDSHFKRVYTGVYDEDDESVTMQYIPVPGGDWQSLYTYKDTKFRLELTDFIDENTIAVLTDKDSDKMVLRSFDLKSKKLGEVIYQHPKYDLTSAGYSGEGKLLYVGYKQDGSQIEAFLSLPQGIDHSTLLVMPHGGPIDVQETDRFNAEVQYFTSRGFAILRVNFRGSAGFGKAFAEKGVGEFGQLIEQDITAAVTEVTKTHQFKNRCAMGASYGGYSAAMLAIKHPDQYDCVVAAFGIYDLPLLFNTSNYRSGEKYSESIAKVVGQFDEKLIDVSPLYLYKQLKAPILLIAGHDDDTADFEHSYRFNYVLEKTDHPIE